MTAVSLFMASLVVDNMVDAIVHFTRDWGFRLVKDTVHASGHRWVEVAPDGGARLRLVEAATDEQRQAIGRQVGRSVAFFLNVENFDATLDRWASNGIAVSEPPRIETYGRVAVLQDKYGNRWDVFDGVVEVLQ